MANINWFLVANTFLTFGAGIWFITKGNIPPGLLQLNFTISNLIFIWMALK